MSSNATKFMAMAVALAVVGAPLAAWAAGATTQREIPLAKASGEKADQALAKGLKYLAAAQQEDGAWVPQWGPAVTAMVVKALVQNGEPVDSPRIAKAVKFILATQKTEGPQKGAFTEKRVPTYNTAIVLGTLAMLNARSPGKPYDAALKAGLEYLRIGQWDESEDIKKDNTFYGGFGYDNGQGRPDISNTAMAVDALKALKDAGYLASDDPMFTKVQQFIQSGQNFSEANKANWGKYAIGFDGGFIYVPASSSDPAKSNAQSKGEVPLPGGKVGLRSYGTMTYAGFKSYLYSGLSMDDPRVKAAFKWIQTNYMLDKNPGMPEGREAMGLYYYYHLFARGLRAAGAGADVIPDSTGVKHNWREDLINKLAELQAADGSWVNKADNFEEGNPILVTCYCVLALQEAKADTVGK